MSFRVRTFPAHKSVARCAEPRRSRPTEGTERPNPPPLLMKSSPADGLADTLTPPRRHSTSWPEPANYTGRRRRPCGPARECLCPPNAAAARPCQHRKRNLAGGCFLRRAYVYAAVRQHNAGAGYYNAGAGYSYSRDAEPGWLTRSDKGQLAWNGRGRCAARRRCQWRKASAPRNSVAKALALRRARCEGIHELYEPQKPEEQEAKPGQRNEPRIRLKQRNQPIVEHEDKDRKCSGDAQMGVAKLGP